MKDEITAIFNFDKINSSGTVLEFMGCMIGNYDSKAKCFCGCQGNYFPDILELAGDENRSITCCAFTTTLEHLKEEYMDSEEAIDSSYPVSDVTLVEFYEDSIANNNYVFNFVGKRNDKIVLAAISKRNGDVFRLNPNEDYYTAYRNTKGLITESIEEQKKEALLATQSAPIILKALTSRVVAQDDAAKTLVNTILRNMRYGDYEGVKSNILLLGPSGNGKTELVNSLSKILKVPFVSIDVTMCSATGYVGDEIINCLRRLVVAANDDLELAERGIVYFDEVDKLACTGSRDGKVGTADVQNEMLKMLDGDIITVPKGRTSEELSIDTSKIIFIASGAFQRLLDLKSKIKTQIGFGATTTNTVKDIVPVITNQDLIDYGMSSELIRRFSTKIVLKKLSVDDLKLIIENSDLSTLRQYKKALSTVSNVELVYDEELVSAIAKKAYSLGVGASGIKSIVESILSDSIAEIGTSTIPRELIVTKETVEDSKKYVLRKKNEGMMRSELSTYNGGHN